MHKFLGDTPVSITCHACGKQLQKKIKWIKKNKTLKCKKCGKKINLTKQEVKKAVKEVNRAITNFEIALGKLHKSTAKIKKRKPSVKQAAKPANVDPSCV
jgi:DNA-directed RNA polymerase subunit M/transcription elongation factor TFIIS